MNLTNTAGASPPTNYLTYGVNGMQPPMTVSFWIYPLTVGVNYQEIVTFGNTSSTAYVSFEFTLGSTNCYANVSMGPTGGSAYTAQYSSPLTANTWFHVCVVASYGNNVSLYINGSQVAQSSSQLPTSGYIGTQTNGTATNIIRFGGQATTPSNNAFNGYLDDFRIYNKVLTAAQILQLYNNNASTTTLTPYLTPRSVLYTTPSLPANAWSKVSVTLPGDLTGSWASDSSTGLNLALCLGAGSNYSSANIAAASNNSASVWNNALVYTASNQVFGAANAFLGSLGNSLLLTGVQLEKGANATPCEIRPYAIENALSTTSMSNGLVVPKLATTSAPGVVQVGSGLSVSGGLLSTLAGSCFLSALCTWNNSSGTQTCSLTVSASNNISVASNIFTLPSNGTYVVSVSGCSYWTGSGSQFGMTTYNNTTSTNLPLCGINATGVNPGNISHTNIVTTTTSSVNLLIQGFNLGDGGTYPTGCSRGATLLVYKLL